MLMLILVSLTFANNTTKLSEYYKNKKYQTVLLKVSKLSEPSQNDLKWAQKSILNKNSSQDCKKDFLQFSQDLNMIPALKEDSLLKNKHQEKGECAVFKSKFKDEKIISKVLTLYPSAIAKFIQKGYLDPKDRLTKILQNTDEVKKFHKTKKFYLEKLIQLKLDQTHVSNLTKMSWTDEFTRLIDKELGIQEKKYLNDPKYKLPPDVLRHLNNLRSMERFKTLGHKKLLAILWFSHPHWHNKMEELFTEVGVKDWLEVEQSLLKIKSKNSFWFKGKGWEDEEKRFKLRSLFPLVVKMVKSECSENNFKNITLEICQKLKL